MPNTHIMMIYVTMFFFYFLINDTMRWWILLLTFPSCQDCYYKTHICKYYQVSLEIARRNMSKCGMYGNDFSPKFKYLKYPK